MSDIELAHSIETNLHQIWHLRDDVLKLIEGLKDVPTSVTPLMIWEKDRELAVQLEELLRGFTDGTVATWSEKVKEAAASVVKVRSTYESSKKLAKRAAAKTS